MVGENAKIQVLEHLASGRPITRLPKHRVKIGDFVVHVRFRSNPKKGGTVWAFNINPNTLTAHFELWICGLPNTYYLIPNATVQQIYDDPQGYPDYAHPEIRVADIDTRSHRCAYGKNQGLDFSAYFNSHL